MKKFVTISIITLFVAFIAGCYIGSTGTKRKMQASYKARSIMRVCPYCNNALKSLEGTDYHKKYCVAYNDFHDSLQH